MFAHQSSHSPAARNAFTRVINTVDRVALSLLYALVVAGLPMVAIGFLAQTV
ncbi:MAG TPA: hypothetical protein VII63_11365 [Caulobacteraceae bacterium]